MGTFFYMGCGANGEQLARNEHLLLLPLLHLALYPATFWNLTINRVRWFVVAVNGRYDAPLVPFWRPVKRTK